MGTRVGLDIANSAVRAATVRSNGKGQPTLERIGQVMLPPGAVKSGEIEDLDAVAEAVKALWSRYGFKTKKVTAGIANQQVVVRQLDLPYLPEEQLRESLQFQVQDAIPIPIDEAILDFSVLENYETQEGESYSRILLVAAQRDAVSTVTDTVGKAKLAPRSLDLDALALLRSLAPESWIEEAGGGEAIVDVGSSVTNVVVHQDRIPAFVRIVVMGGQGITEALSQSLGVSFDEAEELKATGSEEQEALGTETNRVIDEKLDRFCEEIRGSLDFYASQESAVPIQRVVVTGGGSRLRYLPERLAQVLGLPVVSGHPMQGLKIGDVGLSHQELVDAEPYLSVAIGLAMEDS